MAITYPLDHPSTPGFRSIRMTARNVVGVSSSIFSLAEQVTDHSGDMWAADVTLPPMKRADAEAWCAWLTALRGRYGTFRLGDSVGKTPRGVATLVSSAIAPYVNGGSQTGSTLSTAGWTASTDSILRAGDYIQMGGTNLLLRSSEFDNAAWSKSNVTVTANSTTAPDGTMAADTLASGTGDCNLSASFTPANVGQYHTFSLWLKCDTGTVTTDIAIAGVGAYTSQTITITTTWQRFSVSAKVPEATGTVVIGRSNDIPDSKTLYGWGAQVNPGSDADAYVGTSGTASVGTARLHKVVADAASDGSSVASLEIWPRLRASPGNGAYIKLLNARGTFRLADNVRGWEWDPAKVCQGLSFSAVEALNV